ncbi:MAG: hypothetical protein U0353_34545 [Sandaracinus sp.]
MPLVTPPQRETMMHVYPVLVSGRNPGGDTRPRPHLVVRPAVLQERANRITRSKVGELRPGDEIEEGYPLRPHQTSLMAAPMFTVESRNVNPAHVGRQ